MERGVIRGFVYPQSLSQFSMLCQTHFGLTQSPSLVAHQADDGQQLRLSEDVLGELATVVG
jgi:hypothetical protein